VTDNMYMYAVRSAIATTAKLLLGTKTNTMLLDRIQQNNVLESVQCGGSYRLELDHC